MQLTLATVLALANAAFAQVAGFHAISKPESGEQVPAGSTYEIVWQPNAEYPGTVAIDLLGGSSPATLSVVDAIADGVDGSIGSYSWSVDESHGEHNTYGIMITLEDDVSVFQYGFPFQITPSTDDSDDEDDGPSSSSSINTATATATETETETETETATATSSSSVEATVTQTIISSTIRSNLSTTSTTARSTITTLVTQEPPAATTASTTTTVTTNGVASAAAGSFALLGGVAMAVLAL
ncbi:hypothetical protein MMYC01_205023 [Madurella mycetomatis]|uniref:Yeast cell wall synthesis Kre9/Knh1-like N-terminal domain-containing protein n=1 Tax=Madurella mycetomatis TaxID=100816 RepID=A0A175W137_9PEZI|nr:hypothetical protein MMYC01_205023 [Madurella mycetomatis]